VDSLNGRAPEKLHRNGYFAGDLLLPEFMKQVYINPVTQTLNDAPVFSRKIRLNRPSFNSSAPPDAASQ
jgi:hypothetical protein